MRTAIINLGRILTGDLGAPFAEGDAIVMEGGVIETIGPVD